MIRHISLFTLENKDEIPLMKELLEKLGQSDKNIKLSMVKENLTQGPDIFADLVQLIHFDNIDDLTKYVTSKAHKELMQNGPKCEVKAIDYMI